MYDTIDCRGIAICKDYTLGKVAVDVLRKVYTRTVIDDKDLSDGKWDIRWKSLVQPQWWPPDVPFQSLGDATGLVKNRNISRQQISDVVCSFVNYCRQEMLCGKTPINLDKEEEQIYQETGNLNIPIAEDKVTVVQTNSSGESCEPKIEVARNIPSKSSTQKAFTKPIESMKKTMRPAAEKSLKDTVSSICVLMVCDFCGSEDTATGGEWYSAAHVLQSIDASMRQTFQSFLPDTFDVSTVSQDTCLCKTCHTLLKDTVTMFTNFNQSRNKLLSRKETATPRKNFTSDKLSPKSSLQNSEGVTDLFLPAESTLGNLTPSMDTSHYVQHVKVEKADSNDNMSTIELGEEFLQSIEDKLESVEHDGERILITIDADGNIVETQDDNNVSVVASVNSDEDYAMPGMKRKFWCTTCDINFSSRAGLQKHNSLRHKKRCISRKHIVRKTKHATAAKSDARKLKHLEGKTDCDICNFPFASNHALRHHYMSAHMEMDTVPEEEKHFSCPKCGKRFSSGSLLSDHRLVHMTERRHICRHCGKGFKKAYALTVHIQGVHNKDKSLHPCNRCHKSFSCSKYLLSHIKKVHLKVSSMSTFPCPICGKVYRSASGLDYHKLSHKPKVTYSCTLCDKKYTCKNAFYAHEKLHRDGFHDGLPCDLCDKKFTSIYALNKHKEAHSRPEFVTCEICKKSVATRFYPSHLSHHRTPKCKYCGEEFQKRWELAAHERQIHPEHRPYICTVCDKSFADRGGLTMHERSHAPEFHCDYCTMSFIKKSKLLYHIRRRHLEEPRQFPCPVCTRVFQRRACFITHFHGHSLGERRPHEQQVKALLQSDDEVINRDVKLDHVRAAEIPQVAVKQEQPERVIPVIQIHNYNTVTMNKTVAVEVDTMVEQRLQ